MRWIDALVQGVLVGGLYALFATGLSIVFGVMRLVNLAHGDLIVLAAFIAVAAGGWLGAPPALALLIAAPAMAALGYGLQRLVLDRTLGRGVLPPLLVTFALSIVIQNALLAGFSADSRKLQLGGIEQRGLEILPGLFVGAYPLLIFAAAVLVIGALQAVLYRTPLGAAIRATSDDPVTVRLMGLDDRHVFGIAMAASLGVCGVAGVLMAGAANFDPLSGPQHLLYAFEAVIIGGLGSLWGTLAGGIVLGVAQAAGAAIDPGWQVLAGHLAFLAVLLLRPSGLFPRMAG
jgi:branched-chain amino acid transport system permease protein